MLRWKREKVRNTQKKYEIIPVNKVLKISPLSRSKLEFLMEEEV